MKRTKRGRDAEGRRDSRRRTLRDIEDRDWEDESKHLDEDLSEWPEDEGIAEDLEDDWLT